MSVDNTAAGLSILAAYTADFRQVVPAERSAAQLGQVGGSSHQHCESAVCRRLIRIISIRCRCVSSGG